MKILYIEPYYTGSHKQWIDNYILNSKHNIQILGLKGSKWKWRMHGGAITLAKRFLSLDENFDIILCSDMLNLPVFKSLCSKQIFKTKIVVYFHENQLSYPWSPNDPDIIHNRDLHYAFINYSTSLSSDFNFFNSKYHKESYIHALKKYLNKMPDLQNKSTIKEIDDKSSVLHIGCNLNHKIEFKINKHNIPTLLWNHRWEYDKNPETFFNILFEIHNQGINFSLVILGKQYNQSPEIFNKAKVILKDKILYMGYCQSYDEYLEWLNKCDILPVTSIQDFFGVSIIEAVSCGVYPILPNRLSYPELFKNYPESIDLFYNSNKELKDTLINTISNINSKNKDRKKLQKFVINKYDWELMSLKYDQIFEDLFFT